MLRAKIAQREISVRQWGWDRVVTVMYLVRAAVLLQHRV